MSSSAEDATGPACGKCGAPATRLPWLFIGGVTVLTIGMLPSPVGKLCERCAARHDAAGLLLLTLGLGVAFVLAIVVLG